LFLPTDLTLIGTSHWKGNQQYFKSVLRKTRVLPQTQRPHDGLVPVQWSIIWRTHILRVTANRDNASLELCHGMWLTIRTTALIIWGHINSEIHCSLDIENCVFESAFHVYNVMSSTFQSHKEFQMADWHQPNRHNNWHIPPLKLWYEI